MSRDTHVYGWDEEPADERPSEFQPTTGYSVLSGYHQPHDLSARASRRRRGKGLGWKSLLAIGVALLGLCAYAIFEFTKMVRL